MIQNAPQAMLIISGKRVQLQNRAATQLFAAHQFDAADIAEIVALDAAADSHDPTGCHYCQLRQNATFAAVPVALALTPRLADLGLQLAYYAIDYAQQTYAVIINTGALERRLHHLSADHDVLLKINRTQEDERRQLAADLHDAVAQSVSAALMTLRRIQADTNDQRIGAVETQLEETLAQIKGMAGSLHPAVLDQFGLGAALQALIKRLKPTTAAELVLIDRSSDLTGLSNDVQITLYRIAQEALTNALKHSQATSIAVLLVLHHDRIALEVMDDGTGFTPYTQGGYNGKSLGLLNMRARVRALNGFFDIDTTPGHGTTVRAAFPYAAPPTKEVTP
jgi:two-component system sensor histidine kinase NreB